MCDPILVTLLKMQPHPAAHPHPQRNAPPVALCCVTTLKTAV